ncbi:tetratricopeptide repeat protein [Hyphomicrobium sp.]|uniref:tetratricopeptide repeat protein n=1 Tax=Hyphomicrobium sp. TaxID=82 RepID=UPI002E2F8709|nr:tetratricopeptide repeat protein [Hyphomicrobium sp.]HEX2840026.1 tetratricopeptide repeat protein [Hyphomicrobium sp.]
MQRTRMQSGLLKRASLASCLLAIATPGFAGMTQDLSDCTASDRKSSAAACTRVMNSGRLPKEQFYIGHYNRGWSHFNAGDTEKALADFDKSISYNPGYADTYYSRAVIQHDLGHREQSLADLDRYVQKKGEVAEAYLNRARLFRARGELNEAFSATQRAGYLDPSDAKVEVMRALVLSDMGEKTPARMAADKAIAAKPDEGSAYYARALISYREKNSDAAMADLEIALARKDNNISAHELRGRIHAERGETDAAAKSFMRALEIVPKSLEARAAQQEARKRLAELPGGVQIKDKVAQAPSATPPPQKTSSETEPPKCRRFIPSAETTIAVDCP